LERPSTPPEPHDIDPEAVQNLRDSISALKDRMVSLAQVEKFRRENKANVEDLILRMNCKERPFESKDDVDELLTLDGEVMDFFADDYSVSDLNDIWCHHDNHRKRDVVRHLEKRSKDVDKLLGIIITRRHDVKQSRDQLLKKLDEYPRRADAAKPAAERMAELAARIKLYEHSILPHRESRAQKVGELFERMSRDRKSPFLSREDIAELQRTSIGFEAENEEAVDIANNLWHNPSFRFPALNKIEQKHVSLQKAAEASGKTLEQLRQEHDALAASKPASARPSLSERVLGAASFLNGFRRPK